MTIIAVNGSFTILNPPNSRGLEDRLGLTHFTISPKIWTYATNTIGIIAKSGRFYNPGEVIALTHGSPDSGERAQAGDGVGCRAVENYGAVGEED